MNYRYRPGMKGLMDSPTTWDQTDWVMAGLIGFALAIGLSAIGSAKKRLRHGSGTRIWK
jgi:hypothetical protein